MSRRVAAISLSDKITEVADYDMELALKLAREGTNEWFRDLATTLGVKVSDEIQRMTVSMLQNRLKNPDPFAGLPR